MVFLRRSGGLDWVSRDYDVDWPQDEREAVDDLGFFWWWQISAMVGGERIDYRDGNQRSDLHRSARWGVGGAGELHLYALGHWIDYGDGRRQKKWSMLSERIW